MSDRILITGATGFVGQHLVQRLVSEGHSVTGVDIDNRPPESISHLVGDGFEYHTGSVIHENFVDNVLFPTPNAYDRVFHLAAVVGVDRYINMNDPIYPFEVNFDGTKVLLKQIRGSSTRFVYTSTSEIYGKNPDLPWSEEDDQVLGSPTDERWSYAISKSLCEHMIHRFSDNDLGVSSAVVRPFNLYGPYQRPDFVLPKFVDMVLSGEPPTVYGDGSQSRCFTFIEDFIDGIVKASEVEHDTSQVYNLGSTELTTIEHLAKLIIELVDGDVDAPRFVTREKETGEDFDDIETRVPDVSRAKEQLDWETMTPLEQGINATIECMREK
jgi:UDP-glucose 4-epimerase